MALIGKGRGLAALLAFSALTSFAAAQRIDVNPSDVLTAGSTASVTYTDSSRANQSVTVTVSGGFPTPTVHEIIIQLDAKGRGTNTWVVASGWRNAYFNGPGCTEVSVRVQ